MQEKKGYFKMTLSSLKPLKKLNELYHSDDQDIKSKKIVKLYSKKYFSNRKRNTTCNDNKAISREEMENRRKPYKPFCKVNFTKKLKLERSNEIDSNKINTNEDVKKNIGFRRKTYLRKENGKVIEEVIDIKELDQQRLVYKSGECNVNRANIKKRRQRYMADIFTTLVDIKWRWNLLNFVLAFMLSWFIFALLWWLIAFAHGDFDTNNTSKILKTCVQEVTDFSTALLFSIETQQTIGYGSRHTNPYCAEAILAMMCQSCFGVIIQALMTGLVFAKLSRPKKRAETLLFSKNALICKRDGQMCLVFRVGDMRKSHIVEAHVRAIMIKKRVTQEGEVIPLYQYDLKLGDNETEGRLFMVWPVIVEHRITEESPFWTISFEDLPKEKFELVVVLEGIVESTGMTTQARTSYLPEEIIWGYRFEKLVTFQKESNQYVIDYSRFHFTVPIDIPKCSPKYLEEQRENDFITSEEDYEDDNYDNDNRSDYENNDSSNKVAFEFNNIKIFNSDEVNTTLNKDYLLRKYINSESKINEYIPDDKLDCNNEITDFKTRNSSNNITASLPCYNKKTENNKIRNIHQLLKTNGMTNVVLNAFDINNDEFD